MITYEATLVCDRCDSIITGKAKESVNEAENDVKLAASIAGWRRNEFGDLCPTCHRPPEEAKI